MRCSPGHPEPTCFEISAPICTPRGGAKEDHYDALRIAPEPGRSLEQEIDAMQRPNYRPMM